MGIPRKEGMVDIDVEIDNAVISVDLDAQNDSVTVFGTTSVGAKIPIKVYDDGAGKGIVVVAGAPGQSITTSPDVAIPIGTTQPLTPPPAGTRTMIVQNTGPAGSFIRVRRQGEAAGSGIVLARFGVATYGNGGAGAVAPLEVEDVSNAVTGVPVAGSASIQFEGN